MRLSPDAFNAHLAHLGQDVTWRRAYRCPCRNSDSGASRSDCPVCGGIGTTWSDPVAGVVGISGQKVQRMWADFGMWQNGDVVLTIPSNTPVYAIGEFDRVLMADSSAPFSYTFVHDGTDQITVPVVEIDRVFWLSVGGDSIVEGGIPIVGIDGTLTWTAGEPPANQQYSITGRRRPEFFVYGDFPQDRAHHSGAALPRRVVLRLFDLFGRNASAGGVIE